jgi:hypothetical protein
LPSGSGRNELRGKLYIVSADSTELVHAKCHLWVSYGITLLPGLPVKMSKYGPVPLQRKTSVQITKEEHKQSGKMWGCARLTSTNRIDDV